MNNAKNVIVAQSGGATPVINNSLQGVIDTCHSMPDLFGTVYAGCNGIEGILKEELLNLSAQDETEIKLLRVTPAAGAIGTCRYKLSSEREEDYKRIIDVFRAHNVGYFFYIGGNDSMDTANKVAQFAKQQDLDLVVVGVPKTIDNDIGDEEFNLIDHTPGYGSAARYWALTIRNADRENFGSRSFGPVLVLQAMGRKIGFIPAAARLADPQREMPLLIILSEAGLTLEELADRTNDMLRNRGRAIIVISEGFDVGNIGEQKDAFGHTIFAASKMNVAQIVINYLNDAGLAVPGVVRGNVPGTDQHHNIMYASTVDMQEANKVGQHAVKIAAKNISGYMSTMLREPGQIYRIRYDKVLLQDVANSERSFPKSWISDPGIDVTDDYIHYAQPLIGDDWPRVPLVNGLQRFTKFKPIYAEKKLEEYIPLSHRRHE